MSTVKNHPRSAESFNRSTTVFDDDSTFGGTTNPVRFSWTDSVIYGDNIPGWRQKLRDGLNATTSLVGTSATLRIHPGRLKFTVPKSGSGPIQAQTEEGLLQLAVGIPAGNTSDIDFTTANAEAIGKFAKKIVNAQTALQGGVVLGELRQTLQMVKNPARGLRRLVDEAETRLRRIRASRRVLPLASHMRKVAENLGDAWLEYSFGWRPLLNDIRGGASALHNMKVGQSLTTKRITAMGEFKTNPIETTDVSASGIARWSRRNIRTTNSIVVIRGAMRLRPVQPGVIDPELLGFTPDQFLPTAWELMPWSFLIDYFSNIGEVVYGLSTLFTELTWCNRTVKRWFREEHLATSNAAMATAQHSQSSGVSVSPCTVVAEKVRVERDTYTGHFVPKVTFSLPDFGSQKWLNIAALVASRRSDRTWSYD